MSETAVDHVALVRLIPWEEGQGGVEIVFDSGRRVAMGLSDAEVPSVLEDGRLEWANHVRSRATSSGT